MVFDDAETAIGFVERELPHGDHFAERRLHRKFLASGKNGNVVGVELGIG